MRAARRGTRGTAARSSMPESDRETDVAVARRDVGHRTEPAAPHPPQIELERADLEAERPVHASADALEPTGLPVGATAHAQPPRNRLDLRTRARRHGDRAPRWLQLLHRERLEAVAVDRRPGHDEI